MFILVYIEDSKSFKKAEKEKRKQNTMRCVVYWIDHTLFGKNRLYILIDSRLMNQKILTRQEE